MGGFGFGHILAPLMKPLKPPNSQRPASNLIDHLRDWYYYAGNDMCDSEAGVDIGLVVRLPICKNSLRPAAARRAVLSRHLPVYGVPRAALLTREGSLTAPLSGHRGSRWDPVVLLAWGVDPQRQSLARTVSLCNNINLTVAAPVFNPRAGWGARPSHGLPAGNTVRAQRQR